MRIAVVGDTHGHVENTRQAVRMLESLEPERVLHTGDIGTAEVVNLFAPWPTDFVFGNTDSRPKELAEAIEAAGQTCHGMFGELEIEGKRVALLHSHDGRKFLQVTTSGEWDLVCYGHTHKAKIEERNGTTIVNPGAIYRANPHSIALVELPAMEATIVTL